MKRSFTPIALLILSVAACAPRVAEYSPVETPNDIKVTQLALVHDVRFAGGQTQLSPAEMQRLREFAVRDQLGYGDRVTLPGARGATPEATQAAQRRIDAVAAYLRRMGLSVTRLDAPSAAVTPNDRVTVVVSRAVVTPPNCPNWSKSAGFDPTNTAGANFGCATAYNFALQVADPNDLLMGRTPGPADAEQQAASVNRFRSGNIIPLQTQSSRSAGGTPGTSPSGGTAGTTP